MNTEARAAITSPRIRPIEPARSSEAGTLRKSSSRLETAITACRPTMPPTTKPTRLPRPHVPRVLPGARMVKQVSAGWLEHDRVGLLEDLVDQALGLLLGCVDGE